MASIHVDIVSAEGAIFSGEAAMVFAPAKMGEIGIAPRHAPLLTDLKPGEVRVQDSDGDEQRFYVTGGILEDAALAARERAREVLEGRHGEIDLEQAQREMVEAEARYRAAQRLRGKRG